MAQDQATQRLAEILNRIKQLPTDNPEPGQFFAGFLQLAVAATGARGGAIWLTQSDQQVQCYCHIELDACGINESEAQKQLILKAVEHTVKNAKPMVLQPAGAEATGGESDTAGAGQMSNQCGRPLFFSPLKAAQQAAMVLQLIGSEQLNPNDYPTVVGLMDQIGETAETYLAHRRATVLEDDRKSLARLLQYAEAVHQGLDPEKVVYQIANLGREAIGCERVVVWIDPTVKRGLRAVSGVDKPDRRAVLMQSLEKLSKHCLKTGKPIAALRKQLVEMAEEEELTGLLKNYFNVSNLDTLYLQPIQQEQKFLGAMIAEGYDDQSSVNLAGVIATAALHGAVALTNALEMASVPLIRPLSRLKKASQDPKKRRKWTIVSAVILLVLIIAAVFPWTINIDCACTLTPRVRRIVDAPLDGFVIARIVRASGLVRQGETIAELNDAELWAQYHKLKAEHEKNEVLKNQEVSQSENRMIYELELKSLANEIELIKLQIDKCKVRAPITGTILTAQLEAKAGMTLSRGDLICEIADLNSWELVLEAPQEDMGWVQRGFQGQEAPSVRFFLAAYPKEKLHATIAGVDKISQMARISDQGNVYEIRVEVDREVLEPIWSGLRDGSTGRAKIATVSRPLGYVLLRKVIRFFRVTFF